MDQTEPVIAVGLRLLARLLTENQQRLTLVTALQERNTELLEENRRLKLGLKELAYRDA